MTTAAAATPSLRAWRFLQGTRLARALAVYLLAPPDESGRSALPACAVSRPRVGAAQPQLSLSGERTHPPPPRDTPRTNSLSPPRGTPRTKSLARTRRSTPPHPSTPPFGAPIRRWARRQGGLNGPNTFSATRATSVWPRHGSALAAAALLIQSMHCASRRVLRAAGTAMPVSTSQASLAGTTWYHSFARGVTPPCRRAARRVGLYLGPHDRCVGDCGGTAPPRPLFALNLTLPFPSPPPASCRRHTCALRCPPSTA